MPIPGLKTKDLVGIPWRVALALQADGWYLRQDIIWNKPNPMPESVTDRCTKAHEYVFLLSKSERYHYDIDAIKEPSSGWHGSDFHDGKNAVNHPNVGKNRPSKKKGTFNGKTEAMAATGQNAFRAVTETRNKRSVWTVGTAAFKDAHFATFPPALITPMILAGCPVGGTVLDPFGGSGTTGEVAESLGRNSVMIELNTQYIEIQRRRTSQMGIEL
jgi:DNA modification methylase